MGDGTDTGSGSSASDAHAGAGAGRLPVEYRVEYHDDGVGEVWASIDGTDIGGLRWDYYAEPPRVLDVTVDVEFRRQGVATRLFATARAQESRLQHADALLDDGRVFAAATPVGAAPGDRVEWDWMGRVRDGRGLTVVRRRGG